MNIENLDKLAGTLRRIGLLSGLEFELLEGDRILIGQNSAKSREQCHNVSVTSPSHLKLVLKAYSSNGGTPQNSTLAVELAETAVADHVAASQKTDSESAKRESSLLGRIGGMLFSEEAISPEHLIRRMGREALVAIGSEYGFTAIFDKTGRNISSLIVFQAGGWEKQADLTLLNAKTASATNYLIGSTTPKAVIGLKNEMDESGLALADILEPSTGTRARHILHCRFDLMDESGESKPAGVLGLFIPENRPDSFFGDADAAFVQTLASIISLSLSHMHSRKTINDAKMEKEQILAELMSSMETLQRQSALVEQINQINIKINSTLKLNDIFSSIAAYSKNLLHSEFSLAAQLIGKNSLIMIGFSGIQSENVALKPITDANPIVRHVVKELQPVILNRIDHEKHRIADFVTGVEIKNMLSVPITTRGTAAGQLFVFNKRGRDYTQEDLELFEILGRQATNVIENYQLLNNIKQTQITMILKLSEMAEKRDEETGEHLDRIKGYTAVLADEMRLMGIYSDVLDDDYIEDLVNSSPMHDIGKVAIPDHILRKPGQFSPEEWEIMKTHALIGGDILSGPEFLKLSCEIALSHHEKFDGTGYPFGLEGDNIPLSGRIVSLADVYDALTAKRCYKDSIKHEEATAIIRLGRGKHFDPNIVDAFIAQHEVFRLIRESSGKLKE